MGSAIAAAGWYSLEPASLPELPEIEHLKRTLEPLLIGSHVVRVELRRRDIVHPFEKTKNFRLPKQTLLAGAQISSLERRGKNLALRTASGPTVCVHLGMSGQLRFVPQGDRLVPHNHVHCVWHLRSPKHCGRLVFRDPRRFGGLWTFPTIQLLHKHRWASLGPDAWDISGAQLIGQLAGSKRPVKSALLDQTVLCGVGNIYADEALFIAKLHPCSFAASIPRRRIDRLAGAIRAVLRSAVESGGSTIRTYLDANGHNGRFVRLHQVYGRAGKPCGTCGELLEQSTVAQRTTVCCSRCQILYE